MRSTSTLKRVAYDISYSELPKPDHPLHVFLLRASLCFVSRLLPPRSPLTHSCSMPHLIQRDLPPHYSQTQNRQARRLD